MKKRLYTWHRQLGIIACIPLVLWALSGITHPLMNWFQPNIATNQPYSVTLSTQHLMPLHEVLASEATTTAERIRLVELENRTAYQIRWPGNPALQYFDAETGDLIPDGDQRYARQLARHFLGDDRPAVTDIVLLTDFTSQYREINRLLPVYRVSFDREDRIRVYVDTGSSRLGTATDRFRQVNQALFWLFHNFGFLSFAGWFRPVVLLLLSLASALSGLFGIAVFGFTNNPAEFGFRKTHRYLGIAVSLALIMFSTSAFVQTTSSSLSPDNRHLYVDETPIRIRDFSHSVEEALSTRETPYEWSLVSMSGETYHRIQYEDGSTGYLHVDSGDQLPDGDEIYATHLASMFGAPEHATNVSAVHRFQGEYGFINKRLPVVKLEYDDKQTYYIETRTGQLAAIFGQSRRFSGLFFIMIHKWHFLNPIGMVARDVLMILFCLSIAATAGSGIWIYIRKIRKE